MPNPIKQNTLFYGDNLPILHKYVSASRTFNMVKKSTGKQGELGI